MGAGFDGPFEMDRLVSYDEVSLIEEMRRVAGLISAPTITRAEFDRLSRASASTYLRHFGSWETALTASGLGDRYGGPIISAKMRDQRARYTSREEVIAELQRIARLLGASTLRRSDLLEHSPFLGERVVINRFGSWKAAIEASGLELSRHGRRWTEDDYFENLLSVWTHHGRVPKYSEMDCPPSEITAGAYAARFGSWGRAKEAFVRRVNRDIEEHGEPRVAARLPLAAQPEPQAEAENARTASVGLRYAVLRRDRFRCVSCGRSPATELGCVLHVDHIVPLSRGGRTVAENLRTLCATCNLGRGNRYAD